MYDFQKADLWKRISAFLFDFIILAIAAVGVAFLMSGILDYGSYSGQMEDVKIRCEQEYGVDLDMPTAEYEGLSEEDRATYDKAFAAFSHDPDAGYAYTMMINLTLLIVVFSLLIAFLALEMLIPLLFGNGQTMGKKIFGIGVMREDGVRVTPMLLFVRTVLGKYTVETMIPVLLLLMIWFGTMGALALVVIPGMLIMQIVLMATSRARTPIHDKISHTVTVDIASQKIFDSPEELLAYKQKLHDARVQNTDY